MMVHMRNTEIQIFTKFGVNDHFLGTSDELSLFWTIYHF